MRTFVPVLAPPETDDDDGDFADDQFVLDGEEHVSSFVYHSMMKHIYHMVNFYICILMFLYINLFIEFGFQAKPSILYVGVALAVPRDYN